MKTIIKTREALSSKEKNAIQKICNENNIRNGGTLMYDNILTYMYGDDKMLIKVDDNGQVVAYLCVTNRYRNDLYVNQMAVAKPMQRKGIGREILKEAIALAKEKGGKLYSDANATNIGSRNCHISAGMTLLAHDDRRYNYVSE